ncbi:hypothetical protein BS47DRAFT_1298808, partial [Hydnum rufescens UP504]
DTGSMAGAEISQLYPDFPPSAEEPPSVLRGFESVHLSPGKTKLVTIKLPVRLAVTLLQGWSKPQGPTGVLVGTSSHDFRLKGCIAA